VMREGESERKRSDWGRIFRQIYTKLHPCD
jgi:hypothetical protein